MLIQPFIENAIWHGLSPGQALLQIDIRFYRKDDDLVCIIDDNGVGIDSSLKHKESKHSHHSLGIANVRQRILLLNEKYNMKSSLTIEDRSLLSPTGPTGTIVTLHLPIKTTNL
jgi:sensor histidine kinase YesM